MISRFSFFIIYLMIFISISTNTYSQSLKPYIGIHGGINFSQPIILGSNQQIVTLLNGEETNPRIYDGIFKNFGYQIGFSFYLGINDHLSVGLLPEIANYSYGYSSDMVFYNNLGDSALYIENSSKSRINYFNFPIVLQYQQKIQKTTPYLFIGASYGLMRNAQHTVNVRALQDNNIEFNESTSDNYSSEYIKSKFNLLGGVGVMRDLTLCHLMLDLSYWVGLHNIINESNRYNTQSIGGTTYDISDDLKLNHFVLNVSIVFPINKSDNKGSLDCVTQKKKR